MTGATSPWAVCLIASSVPSRSPTLCVAALTYRLSVTVCLCVCIWVQCVCLEAKLSSVSCKIAQKKEVMLKPPTKTEWTCQTQHRLSSASVTRVQYCFQQQSRFTLKMSLSALYNSIFSCPYSKHRLEMLNIFYCIKNVPYVCGGENIYSTVESLNL